MREKNKTLYRVKKKKKKYGFQQYWNNLICSDLLGGWEGREVF